MDKRITKAAIGVFMAGITSSFAAQAETTWFGAVDVSYGFIEESGEKSQELKGLGSRLGVRGFAPMNDGVDATYMLEGMVNLEENEDQLKLRQAWGGLRGSFGEIRAGRQLGSTQVSSEWIEQFENQYGDYNAILKSEHSHRESVAYINKYGPVGVAVEVATDDEYSTSTDRVTATDVMVNYYQNGLYGAAATLRARDNFQTDRLTLAYSTPEGHKVGVAHERHKPDNAPNHQGTVVSGAFQSGQLTFKAQYGVNQQDGAATDEKLRAVGIDYSLGKNSRVTFEYTVNKNRNHEVGNRLDATTIGLVHKF